MNQWGCYSDISRRRWRG